MVKIEFERQDLRRLWLVLGAIEKLESPLLSPLSKVLDMQISTIQKVIERINSDQLPDVEISVSEGRYTVESWGVLNRQKIIEYFEENT